MDGSEDDPEELTRVQEDALWAEFVGSDHGAARIRERLAGSDDQLLAAVDILINFVAETRAEVEVFAAGDSPASRLSEEDRTLLARVDEMLALATSQLAQLLAEAVVRRLI